MSEGSSLRQPRQPEGRQRHKRHGENDLLPTADDRRNTERNEKRIGGSSGMEAQKKDQVRNNKGTIERAPRGLTRLRSGTAGEHHEQAVILPTVVPRTPGQIGSENPRQNSHPGMRQDQRQHDERRGVHREDAVLLTILGAMVSAVNRRHVVRIVEEECQRVKSHRPGTSARRNREVGNQQKRRRPGSAADYQIKPGRVYPRQCRSPLHPRTIGISCHQPSVPQTRSSRRASIICV